MPTIPENSVEKIKGEVFLNISNAKSVGKAIKVICDAVGVVSLTGVLSAATSGYRIGGKRMAVGAVAGIALRTQRLSSSNRGQVKIGVELLRDLIVEYAKKSLCAHKKSLNESDFGRLKAELIENLDKQEGSKQLLNKAGIQEPALQSITQMLVQNIVDKLNQLKWEEITPMRTAERVRYAYETGQNRNRNSVRNRGLVFK
jgi:hypothetical protein